MNQSRKLWIYALLLRVLAFVWFGRNQRFVYLFESRGIAADDVNECAFVLSRGFDPYAMGCRVPPMWLLLFRLAQAIGVSIPLAMFAVNVAADFFVARLWKRLRCKAHDDNRDGSGRLTYLLLLFNPVHILATAVPSLQPLNTLLLLLLLGASQMPFLAGAALAMLTLTNGQYLALAAPVLALASREQRQLPLLLVGITATAAAVFSLASLAFPNGTWLTMTTLGAFYAPLKAPHPGVLWYLQTEIFSTFQNYFSLMTAIHPLFYMMPMTARFWRTPQLAADIVALLLLVFGCAPGFSDICLVFYLLFSHTEVLPFMRHKEFVSMFALMPLALLPIIQVQWMEIGNANANYYFFAGLAITFSSALGIVEFSSAAVKWQRSQRPQKQQSIETAPSDGPQTAAAAAQPMEQDR